jgi:parvulin-like peptidyl-prolyl isomerase
MGILAAMAASLGVIAAAEPLVLARGKGVNVTQDQLDEAFINLRATLAAKGQRVPESKRDEIERDLVEKLALTQILLSKATEADRKEAEAKVAKLIQQQKEQAGSEARFEAQVRAAGLDPRTFNEQLLERAVCEEVLDRELRPLLGITPEKVRSYYDQHPNEFRQPERVRLQQIVLSTRHPSGAELSQAEKSEKRSLAERLLKRAQNGESLAELAREFSDDPAGREREGIYLFPVGRIVPELEVAVLSMPTNQLSGIIETPYGMHIVKVLERLPGEMIPFETVSEQIRARMELQLTQESLPAFQKRLFEEARVEFTKPRR